MGHRGIFGMTESGKTRLAIALSYRFRDRGIPRVILDPMLNPLWEPVADQDWLGKDSASFTRLWRDNTQCALFVDESSKTIGRYAAEMNDVCTMARHWGHETHVIGQRPQQIDPTIREQFSEVYLFRCSPSVAKIFAEEFADARLMKSTELGRGEFIIAKRFEMPHKCKIDLGTLAVSYI